MTTLVWFKRDLRVTDHAPLLSASDGPCICLYIYEPSLIEAPDHDPCHLAYVNGCLAELAVELEALGGRLVTRVGEAVDVFERLHAEHPFDRIVCHQETGNYLTYMRDRKVRRWSRQHGIALREWVQDGVVRGLKSRDGWAAQWDAQMRSAIHATPQRLHPVEGLGSAGILKAGAFGRVPHDTDGTGFGHQAAVDTLEAFLTHRGERYQAEMSSPVTAESACSRMSPFIAYGVLSRRTIFQRFEERRAEVRAGRKAKTGISADWSRAMASFNKRLHWNGHFIQRLELQPELEFTNMSRTMDGLREDDFNEDYFTAWCEGQTGYPMVDACMRYLRAHRWINFRMRAMLTSFASYHLWLDWRRTSVFLARQFTDYEPGIHYSQIQMQSGTTGINSVRIYSPIKQALDHDPEGIFIRRWVPELASVPTEHVVEPHKMTAAEQDRYGCIIGTDYPAPLVEHKEAVKDAKSRVYAFRRKDGARSEAKQVYERHGSRKRPRRRAKA